MLCQTFTSVDRPKADVTIVQKSVQETAIRVSQSKESHQTVPLNEEVVDSGKNMYEASKKKQSLKRKEAPSSDSEYDVEEDVPDITPSASKKKTGGKKILRMCLLLPVTMFFFIVLPLHKDGSCVQEEFLLDGCSMLRLEDHMI
ncbi:hypothetical protein L195_g052966 [Trifolium pratense]|uniref:Uncharacterized protein n=1 Tax=Trifolium pratense TaxID=57577 RepID=A0A2K3K7Z1_TRIPR|nr:hypothetical protein L195_g052966 [Trifolium pratense]